MSLRRLSAALLAVALATALGACGDKEETITQADTEGLYLDVGGLTYQIQLSRQLNPRDVEDQVYFRGLAPGTPRLKPTESWFGVFLRVNNEEDRPIRATDDFRVTDTQYEEGRPCIPINGCYRPTPLDSRQNPFAYAPTQIDPGELYPPLSSAGQEGVTGGMMVLFRVPYGSYENRPLELHVSAAEGEPRAGVVELDL